MRIAISGTGTATRVNEALDAIHTASRITLMGIRDEDHPAAAWARRNGVPTTLYIPTHMIDLGVILPDGGIHTEAWHARMLMDDVPCMEIHE